MNNTSTALLTVRACIALGKFAELKARAARARQLLEQRFIALQQPDNSAVKHSAKLIFQGGIMFLADGATGKILTSWLVSSVTRNQVADWCCRNRVRCENFSKVFPN